ncbi:MAG: protein phosphatase 2C domain-containing protein [Desulfobulbaceae bacterium]|nr:protein phosphatase 2C domain-containing protein [Desulfobulbaceae bacterium]
MMGRILSFLKKIFWPDRPISCFGRTDTGMVRKNNEDNFAILPERNFFLVADGMGGHNAGEVASRVATECLIEFFTPEKIARIRGNALAIGHELLLSFHCANQKVMDMSSEDPDQQGMGCTFIACLIDGNTAYFCHVGDVRAYLADSDSMKQITTDHSLVREQEGTAEGKGNTFGRHVITRGIGFPFPEEPELHQIPLQSGNQILLCTDGLWGMLDDDEMSRVLQESQNPEEACDTLVHQANEAGGKDNITAVVICR